MKKKENKPEEVVVLAEVKPAEVKPEEVKPEVRLEPEVVPPATPEPVAAKPAELGESIDNLAKIVDSSSAQPRVLQEPATETTPEGKENNKGYLWLLISFLLGLALGIGAGYLIWGRTVKTEVIGKPVTGTVPTQAVQQISPIVTPPAATPSPANLKKSVLKMEVLNGSGGKGVAAKAKDLLTAAGYTDITAGNADREDYAQTEISIKASRNVYLGGLKKDLSGQYTVAEKVTTIPESEKYDVIIVIGQK